MAQATIGQVAIFLFSLLFLLNLRMHCEADRRFSNMLFNLAWRKNAPL